MADNDPRTVTLKRVRLSFTQGIKDKRKTSDAADAKERHNFNIIEETGGKFSEQNRERILAALAAAGEKAWKDPDAYKKIAEDNPKRVTYKKGERFKSKEGKVYAGYEGNFGMSVSGPGGGQRRPKLLDRHKRPVDEADIMDVFYSGTYADVIVSFYGTDKGSRGIFATCELIRSHQEGEAMGGGYVFSDDDLDELEDLEDDDDGLSSHVAPKADSSASDVSDFM